MCTSHSEKMVQSEEKNKTALLVAQEIELAKLLAGNNKNVRDKALRNLKKWLYTRSQAVPFTDDDLLRIWKGLFYSMWMCDKPLIQEESAENISSLVHFPTYELSLQFFKAGLTIISNEWLGIDQLRLDKFLMLVRRLLRHMLTVLKEKLFTEVNIEKFNEVISNTVLSTEERVPFGLVMHFSEIFMEELSKVTEGHIRPDSVVEFLRPFIKKLVRSDDGRQVGHIRRFVFTYLIRQTDLGLDYQEKYEAWKKLGFPGNINSIQKIKINTDEKMLSDEDEDIENSKINEKTLDPRAGRVDVELSQLKFNSKKLSEILMDYKFDKNGTQRGRNMISILSSQFAMLANGKYPLGITKLDVKEKNEPETNIHKAANKLIKFEQNLRNRDMKRKRSKSTEEEKKEELTENPKLKRLKIVNSGKENGNVVLLKKKKKGGKNVMIQKAGKIKRNGNNKITKNIQSVKKFINTEKKYVKDGFILTNENKTSQKQKRVHTKSLTEINAVVKTTKKTQKQQRCIDNIECVFKRNSGTWVVFDVSTKSEENLKRNGKGTLENALDTISVENNGCNYFKRSESKSVLQSNPIKSKKSNSLEASFETKMNDGSPNNPRVPMIEPEVVGVREYPVSPEKLKKPIKLLESPPRGRALFPRTEWDAALQEGEYEVFVPSKKYLKKMQKLAKRNSHTHSQVLVTPSQNNQVKSRRSLDPSLMKNQFFTPSSSSKKVNFNTKLNRSQEIYEHHMQILNSPGIPHDPNKKPAKPVLKSLARTNSINPFYDKQLNIW